MSFGVRNCRTSLIIATACLTIISAIHCPCFAADAASQSAPIEKQLRELYARVSPAIVRICLDSEGDRHLGVGVIVSPKGYVATANQQALVEAGVQKKPLYFFFSNGQRAEGVMRGWSEEWNVACAQIAGGGD